MCPLGKQFFGDSAIVALLVEDGIRPLRQFIVDENDENFSVEFELIYTIGRNASGRLLNMAVVMVPKTLITS